MDTQIARSEAPECSSHGFFVANQVAVGSAMAIASMTRHQIPEVARVAAVAHPSGTARHQATGELITTGPESNKTKQSAPAVDTQIGRHGVPLAKGGKPFKTQASAGQAKKLQRSMRVVIVGGGYALAEKTSAQLAAQEKAAKRLALPKTSPAGLPIPAHAFIAARGGLAPSERADMGLEGNLQIGNRWLFAGPGKGLTMERATEKLTEDRYLPENASQEQVRTLIKRSLTQPQYTAEGFEHMAEAEANARFEDYLTASLFIHL